MHTNIHAQLERVAAEIDLVKAVIDQNPRLCRCCGENLRTFFERVDRSPIHTRCIPKHWGKHGKGINASRCKEFGKGSICPERSRLCDEANDYPNGL